METGFRRRIFAIRPRNCCAIAPTYRVNAAVEHDGLAHVLEDDAAAADLVAGPNGHDAHRLMVIFRAFHRGKRGRRAKGIGQSVNKAIKQTAVAHGDGIVTLRTHHQGILKRRACEHTIDADPLTTCAAGTTAVHGRDQKKKTLISGAIETSWMNCFLMRGLWMRGLREMNAPTCA